MYKTGLRNATYAPDYAMLCRITMIESAPFVELVEKVTDTTIQGEASLLLTV